jgi:hypothetical protein
MTERKYSVTPQNDGTLVGSMYLMRLFRHKASENGAFINIDEHAFLFIPTNYRTYME